MTVDDRGGVFRLQEGYGNVVASLEHVKRSGDGLKVDPVIGYDAEASGFRKFAVFENLFGQGIAGPLYAHFLEFPAREGSCGRCWNTVFIGSGGGGVVGVVVGGRGDPVAAVAGVVAAVFVPAFT